LREGGTDRAERPRRAVTCLQSPLGTLLSDFFE